MSPWSHGRGADAFQTGIGIDEGDRGIKEKRKDYMKLSPSSFRIDTPKFQMQLKDANKELKIEMPQTKKEFSLIIIKDRNKVSTKNILLF